MRCYTAHKGIVRLVKIMSDVDNIVCIDPSSALVGMCCKAKLSEPVYSEVSKERFKFQFSVQVTASCCEVMDIDDKILATGYSFRDKSDAIESGALAMLDLLMYRYGIRAALYSDLVFVKKWPGYNHISENLKATCLALLGITDDISSLIRSIADCGNSFEAEKSIISDVSGDSSEIGGSAALDAILNDCHAEIQRTHQSLFADIREHMEAVRWRCNSHRFYQKGYYEAVHRLHKDLDIKMESIGTLKATLDKVCEKGGYAAEALSSRCVSEGSYIVEMVLIKNCGNAELERKFNISSGSCSNIHECHRDAIYRGITTVCVEEGVKIIDAGYLDLRDMQKEHRDFRHEVPLLCNIVGRMKAIVEEGFKNIDVLSQHHYRRLKDHKFSKELRLSLADCICDFIHIIKSLDKEAKKLEVYSSNFAPRGDDGSTL